MEDTTMTDTHNDEAVAQVLRIMKKHRREDLEFFFSLPEEDRQELYTEMREALVIDRRASFRVIDGGEG